MSFINIYIYMLLMSSIIFSLFVFFEFKKDLRNKELKNALADFKIAIEGLCMSVGFQAGTFIAALITISACSLFIALLPLLTIIKVFSYTVRFFK